MPLLETYGSYQLVEKLAMGGMAQLYLARRKSKGTDRTVVLKRILPHLAEDTAFVTMFLDDQRLVERRRTRCPRRGGREIRFRAHDRAIGALRLAAREVQLRQAAHRQLSTS